MTDLDTLITALPLALPHLPPIHHHIVLGYSLGGHAAWHILLDIPLVRAAAIIVGCPDYAALMEDRAARAGLEDTDHGTDLTRGGAKLLGSRYFPISLMEKVGRYDPGARLFPSAEMQAWMNKRGGDYIEQQKRNLRSILGKKVLCLFGAEDELVPYSCSRRVLQFVRHAEVDGQSALVEEEVFAGAGHEISKEMLARTSGFVITESRSVAA